MTIGKVRERKSKAGNTLFYLDFYPHIRNTERFLYSELGVSFEDEKHAQRVLDNIRTHIARRTSISDAIGLYRSARTKPNLISTLAAEWIEDIEREGVLEPYTLRQYRGMVANHFPVLDRPGGPRDHEQTSRSLAGRSGVEGPRRQDAAQHHLGQLPSLPPLAPGA